MLQAALTKHTASLQKLPRTKLLLLLTVTAAATALLIIALIFFWRQQVAQSQKLADEAAQNLQLDQNLAALSAEFEQTEASLSAIMSEDQFQRNETLQAEIKSIEQVFTKTVSSYEDLLDLGNSISAQQALYAEFSQILSLLARRNYSSASAKLTTLDAEIAKKQVAAAAPIPANVAAIQEAPSSGYRRQSVTTEYGTYLVDVIAADLNSTRVQVETASEGDCADGCPVDSLASFIAKSGGYAGINGPYFCPAEYPSCAGKTNSFDTLLMNKNKVYFNSANNVHSVVPAVIFSGNSARFVGRSLDWGRDTGVDAVIAAQPLLLMNGEVKFTGDGDPKKGSVGSRSFIASRDNTVYIGVVRGATVAEVAYVLKEMGLQNALNLDSGGSTALYADGRYLAGPGRNTPFGIVLVRK
jgi:exopolysaccharide biosynthesis protein